MPHNHRAEYLTTEQRQQVNAAITEAGFPLDDFEQGRTDSEHTPNLKVFCVKHFDSGSFIFDRDGQRRVSIRRVGVATKPEVLTPRDWPGELKNFQQWLKLLRKEIEKRERAALDAGDVQAEKEQQGFREYKGDTYLVDGWVADGDSFKQAIQRVQDPQFLAFWLGSFGKQAHPGDVRLAQILKDRYATQALCEAVTNRDRSVLRALVAYAKQITPRLKPGPQPQEDTGEYRQDTVAKFKQSRPDLSSGGVALRLTGDPSQASNIRAAWSNYQKRAAAKKQASPPKKPQ